MHCLVFSMFCTQGISCIFDAYKQNEWAKKNAPIERKNIKSNNQTQKTKKNKKTCTATDIQTISFTSWPAVESLYWFLAPFFLPSGFSPGERL